MISSCLAITLVKPGPVMTTGYLVDTVHTKLQLKDLDQSTATSDILVS